MIVLDAMLGKLSRYLRMLGYDLIIINNEMKDDEIINNYHDYLILTRDKVLAKKIKNSIYVESDEPIIQLKQIYNKLPKPDNDTFSLCTICGGKLKVADHSNIPEYVPEDANLVYFCPKCNKYYWYGSHIKNFIKMMEKIGIEI